MKVRTLSITVLLALCLVIPAQSASLDSARALADDGRTGDALAEVDRVLDNQPENAEALLLQGVLLMRSNRTDEAKRVFLDTARLEPNWPEPRNNLAALYSAAGDYESAIRELKAALSTDESYRTAYENLTQVYGKLASQAYDRALGQRDSSGAKALRLAALDQPTIVQAPVPVAVVAQVPAPDPEPVPAPEPAEEMIVEEPESPAAPELAPEPAPAEEPAPSDESAGEVEDLSPDPDAVLDAVNAWAAAWSAQDVDGYLGAYADGFEPPGGQTRPAWESVRRDRLTRPQFVRVSVASPGIRHSGPGRATVRFHQTYESDTFGDEVTKTLEMVWEDGSWKILSEFAE